jgi:putative thioredoxin
VDDVMQEQTAERPDPAVVEVGDADFEQVVLEGSRERPVVVDFWAEWCAPCRQLGPVLERLAEEKGGEFLLAKLDTDANQYTAAQFDVRSIPLVVGFVDGRPVDSFVGAMPEPAVRQWVERLLPSSGDRAALGAEALERAGRFEEAEREYRAVLSEEPGNRAAKLGLARCLAYRGETSEAEETVRTLLPDPEAERLLSALRVEAWRSLDGSAGGLDAARAAAPAGRWREALDAMLAIVRDDPEGRDEGRAAMLDVFAVLGDEDPIVREYRTKLASALF